MTALCLALEKWRAEQKQAERDSPDEPPPFDWRSAVYALAWDIGLAILLFLVRSVREPQTTTGTVWWFWVIWGCATLAVAGGTLQLIRAFGMQTERFWRAHWREFRTSDNYPFTPLTRTLDADSKARSILEPFSTQVVQATYERLQIQESDLRERIASVLGSPSLLALFAVPAPIWAAWQTYKADRSTIPMLVLGASIFALIVLIFGLRLRVSLTELARCRLLLSLELAHRKHG